MATLKEKIIESLRNPKAAWYYLFRKKYKQAASSDYEAFQKKIYSNYDEYLDHQKKKLNQITEKGMYAWFPEYDNNYRDVLRERLRASGFFEESGKTVLCLAARLGTEVKAFLDLGCFAIGIDLNPGKENKYVVSGDFHDIQFPDHSVDIIFSNSFDHAFDFRKLIAEVKRVLKPEGFLVLDIDKDVDENGEMGYFETHSWESPDDLINIFTEQGFELFKRSDISYPWKGEHVYLRLKKTLG